MKTLLVFSLLVSLNSFAQTSEKKEEPKKDNLDYGDKQLLQRDACRKPTEALETKYDMKKEDIEKLKEKCPY